MSVHPQSADTPLLKSAVKRFFDSRGYQLSRPAPFLPDNGFREAYERCRPNSMTSTERMYSLYESIEYLTKNNIPGDIVECGVWRGGSSMLAALALLTFKSTERRIYLYDTFEGMAEPTEKDVSVATNQPAWSYWKQRQHGENNEWCYASVDEVRKNLVSTGYPEDKLVFVKGKVEETIPNVIPDRIALLRLDTDWYDSTYHEFTHLYPRLSPLGVVIIDDYGSWAGSREATDQYLSETNAQILLHRIDSSRIGVKIP